MHTSVRVQSNKKFGKLLKPSLSATSDGNTISCSRLLILDINTKQQFLIDTGAEVSVLPPTYNELKMKSDLKLYAANSSVIETFGFKSLHLNLGLRRSFPWRFTIAKVDKPIIGADFLKHYGLLVDVKNKKLVDPLTSLKSNTQTFTGPPITITVIQTNTIDPKIVLLLKQFHEITHENETLNTIKHDVIHCIDTTGQPVSEKTRRLNVEKMIIAKKEIENWLRLGICRPSKSNWASPLHLTKKKNGSWRVCGDYRGLNDRTKHDRYPIPFITDFNQQLEGCQIFSTIDLVRAYNQIAIKETDIEKTAVCTPFGLFEFVRMPFGLRNAAQTFQRLIHSLFRDLNFIFPYLDDLLIASNNMEEHLEHLRTVCDRLSKAGLVINPEKCVFAQTQVTFLGFDITAKGISPAKARVEAIVNYQRPTTIKGIHRFLGMINFYRIFIPHAAHEQAPLYAFLKGKPKKDNSVITWTPETTNAFELCKTRLIEATRLIHPAANAELAIMVDASSVSIGAVIQQKTQDGYQPLSFFSKKLTKTEQNYSTYDRELLAAYRAVKHFKHFIEAREFTLFTDHKPLIYAFKQKLDKASPRQQRHLDLIAQYTTDIKHISGEENVVADTLSRIEEIELSGNIDFESIANEQEEDEEFRNLINSNTNLKFEKFPLFNANQYKMIYCDTSTGTPRPFIPKKFRHQIFNTFHNLSHPGTRASTNLIRKKFIWPSLNKDVRSWAKNCIQCQRAKVTKHIRNPVGNYKITSKRFDEIHVDLVGPLPPSEDMRYCVTLIDRYTRWPEAIPVPDIRATTVADAILKTWFCRFGIPSVIITDRGAQFESELFSELSKLLGVKRKRTTAYNPACNGMIERWHRSLKAALMSKENIQWTKTLPIVLLGLRAAIREDFGTTSAELVYGETIKLPGDFIQKSNNFSCQSEFVSDLRKIFEKLQPTPPSHHNKERIFISKNLSDCSHVLVRTDSVRAALQQPYEGPFPVIKRTDKYFTLTIKGKEVNVSINRLKPCFIEATDAENIPLHTPKHVISTDGNTIKNNDKRPIQLDPEYTTNSSRPKKSVSFATSVAISEPFKSHRTSRTGRTIKTPVRFRN